MTDLTAMPQGDSKAEQDIQLSVNAESWDPARTIDRPFPVSASVENYSPRNESPYDEVYQTLERMAREPRDPAWAPEMESRLRDLLNTAEPEKFSIRAIECRSSLCAVEVASLFGPLSGRIDSRLDNKLSSWIGLFGYEARPSSTRVTVTLMTFKRP